MVVKFQFLLASDDRRERNARSLEQICCESLIALAPNIILWSRWISCVDFSSLFLWMILDHRRLTLGRRGWSVLNNSTGFKSQRAGSPLRFCLRRPQGEECIYWTISLRSVVWIAFRITILVTIHRCPDKLLEPVIVVNCFQFCNFMDDSKAIKKINAMDGVVNCFQFCNFMDDSQAFESNLTNNTGCELLSVL